MNALKSSKKELCHIEIHPDVDGVFHVIHSFKTPDPERSGNGPVQYIPPPDPEHHYATSAKELHAHIDEALGIK
jgi:hypothetical protein